MDEDIDELQIPFAKQVSYALQFLSGIAYLWFKRNFHKIALMNWCDFTYNVLWEFDPTTKPPEEEELTVEEKDNNLIEVIEFQLDTSTELVEDDSTMEEYNNSSIEFPVSDSEKSLALRMLDEDRVIRDLTLGSLADFGYADASLPDLMNIQSAHKMFDEMLDRSTSDCGRQVIAAMAETYTWFCMMIITDKERVWRNAPCCYIQCRDTGPRVNAIDWKFQNEKHIIWEPGDKTKSGGNMFNIIDMASSSAPHTFVARMSISAGLGYAQECWQRAGMKNSRVASIWSAHSKILRKRVENAHKEIQLHSGYEGLSLFYHGVNSLIALCTWCFWKHVRGSSMFEESCVSNNKSKVRHVIVLMRRDTLCDLCGSMIEFYTKLGIQRDLDRYLFDERDDRVAGYCSHGYSQMLWYGMWGNLQLLFDTRLALYVGISLQVVVIASVEESFLFYNNQCMGCIGSSMEEISLLSSNQYICQLVKLYLGNHFRDHYTGTLFLCTSVSVYSGYMVLARNSYWNQRTNHLDIISLEYTRHSCLRKDTMLGQAPSFLSILKWHLVLWGTVMFIYSLSVVTDAHHTTGTERMMVMFPPDPIFLMLLATTPQNIGMFQTVITATMLCALLIIYSSVTGSASFFTNKNSTVAISSFVLKSYGLQATGTSDVISSNVGWSFTRNIIIFNDSFVYKIDNNQPFYEFVFTNLLDFALIVDTNVVSLFPHKSTSFLGQVMYFFTSELKNRGSTRGCQVVSSWWFNSIAVVSSGVVLYILAHYKWYWVPNKVQIYAGTDSSSKELFSGVFFKNNASCVRLFYTKAAADDVGVKYLPNYSGQLEVSNPRIKKGQTSWLEKEQFTKADIVVVVQMARALVVGIISTDCSVCGIVLLMINVWVTIQNFVVTVWQFRIDYNSNRTSKYSVSYWVYKGLTVLFTLSLYAREGNIGVVLLNRCAKNNRILQFAVVIGPFYSTTVKDLLCKLHESYLPYSTEVFPHLHTTVEILEVFSVHIGKFFEQDCSVEMSMVTEGLGLNRATKCIVVMVCAPVSAVNPCRRYQMGNIRIEATGGIYHGSVLALVLHLFEIIKTRNLSIRTLKVWSVKSLVIFIDSRTDLYPLNYCGSDTKGFGPSSILDLTGNEFQCTSWIDFSSNILTGGNSVQQFYKCVAMHSFGHPGERSRLKEIFSTDIDLYVISTSLWSFLANLLQTIFDYLAPKSIISRRYFDPGIFQWDFCPLLESIRLISGWFSLAIQSISLRVHVSSSELPWGLYHQMQFFRRLAFGTLTIFFLFRLITAGTAVVFLWLIAWIALGKKNVVSNLLLVHGIDSLYGLK